MSQVSRYEIIWKTLKANKEAHISAPKQFHSRLKKAIIKRKDIDTAYKFQLGEQNQQAKLQFSSSGSLLSVTLTIQVRSDYL